ncbi:MAG: hypothetical protein LKF36_00435 [Lactobacillus sp.]|nr:hypothetical protein [Lactobacillus sp.]
MKNHKKLINRNKRVSIITSVLKPLDTTIEAALADVKAGRTTRYESFEDWKAAVKKL